MKKNGILDWFKFESKAKREKRERKYYSMMFPMGPEQRDWEVSTIEELFPDMKKRSQEIHFAVLTLREALACADLDEDDEEYVELEEGIEDWMESNITRELAKKGMAPELRAMAELEYAAKEFSELPTASQIKVKAEEYREQFKAMMESKKR